MADERRKRGVKWAAAGAGGRATFPRLAGLIAIGVGGLVLAGWVFDVAWLKSVAPGLATMKANTALAFILAGGALFWLAAGPPTSTSRLAAGRLCAGVAALIGLLTLSQDLLGWNLGIDQLLFADPVTTLSPPGRMSSVTALSHTLLGVALLLVGWESLERLRQWLAVAVFALAWVALLGYAYGVQSLYRVGPYASVALPTAIAFAILSLGVLFTHPGRGIVAILTSRGPGGASARRLLPAAIAVPFLVGWLRLWGERMGLYDTPFGLALFALSNIVIFTLLIGWNARRLDQADSRRQEAEMQARQVNRALRTLSECNQILVRTTQEDELLQRICRIIVELGGYRLAWVGYAEADETRSVRPVAQAGYEAGYLQTLNITWADSERGRGPTGAAIRTGRPVVARDILTDPHFFPWRKQALQRGYASSIALPLRYNEQPLGALNIYAAEPDAFDEEEVKLLTELADDLAFGIGALRTRQDREQAEEQVRQQAIRANALAEFSQLLAEVTLDFQAVLETVARRLVELIGDVSLIRLLSEDQQWLNPAAFYHPDPEAFHFMRELLAKAPQRITEGPTGQVARTGQPLLIASLPQAALRAQIDPAYAAYFDRYSVYSLLIVPMRLQQWVIGVVGIGRGRPGQPYTLDDQTFLQDLADRVALALTNARLHGQLQRHTVELEERVAERTHQLAQANEQLKELDRLKSKFVGDVSYQLRTPIANLQVYLDLMARGKPEKQETYLAVARQEIRQLRQFIGNVLDMSRLSMSQESLQLRPVELNSLVEQVVNVYTLRAEAAGLFLSCELEPAVPPVRAERNLLGEVIAHLLDNAIHYTVEGEVHVRTLRDGRGVCLAISDTGVGIPAEDLPYLFDHFYRGQSASQLNVPGAGLGLGIVKEIVTLHGGQVEVESQVGVGSTFRVCLPVV
ncbi:MAG: GAF domain-containing sensor histidine kinase [Chloroflexota bacterium]